MITQHKPKVLVVNDDPGSLIGLTGLLSQWEDELGFEVRSARSGVEALREVLKQEFAVILLDVNMPGMNGFETARAIHDRRASASTPIIFITAYLADEMNRLKGYEHGAVDYLFTPFVPQTLKSKLAVFVALAEQRLQLTAQSEALNQRAEELIAINQRLQSEVDRRKEAEQRTKTSQEFLAMLGHELRNPLAAISNAGILLSIAGVSEQQKTTAIQVVQRQTQQLSRIMDDLLDLSRVLAGKIQLSRRVLDLGQMVQACIETLNVAGRTRQHDVSVDVEACMVDVDPARMEQVITNLVDNAIKYTPEGGKVSVQVKNAGDDVVLTVRDTGIGMPPELVSRIFDIFVQGEQPLNRPRGGLGIGLSLVRQLVLLHGGSVRAECPPEGGSVFEVRLSKIQSEHLDSTSPRGQDYEDLPHSILLVEDNEDSRQIMELLLTTLGHKVYATSSGMEGVSVACEQVPEIALIDIGLPGMNGYEVAKALRTNPLTRGMKLIALTGYGSEHDKVKALDAGFDMHLVKPVTTDRLFRALNQCNDPITSL